MVSAMDFSKGPLLSWIICLALGAAMYTGALRPPRLAARVMPGNAQVAAPPAIDK